MPYNPTLPDALSRVRFGVGDIDPAQPLLPDATYHAVIARQTTGDPPMTDEAAAIRDMARALAARYATQPTSISSSGKSLNWAERVAQWNRIAEGNAGGAEASTAKGFRLRRGPASDYTTGGGDA